jgi:hypothetical protein
LATPPSRAPQIALVAGKGFADGEQLPGLNFADGVIAPGELARHLAGPPVVEDGRAVAVLVIVGERKALQPGAARTVRLQHRPDAA